MSDRQTDGKWLIYNTKHHKDNQTQILKHLCGIIQFGA